MDNKTNVLLREQGISKTVSITDSGKPQINLMIMNKWQKVINIIAKIVKVQAALIMQITEESMTVFLRSDNAANPYQACAEDKLGHGLYCETVIGADRELLIDNALQHNEWKDNPDVKLNMISYFGLPIKWPDNEYFGTICILDDKPNSYNEEFKELLREFKSSVESDLELLCYQQKLIYYSEMDILTSVYNRRKMEETLLSEFKRSKRTSVPYSVAIIDMDHFKHINDTYGHTTGDKVLKAFANEMHERIRTTDFFGRLGGDEFILICPVTKQKDMELLIRRLREPVVSIIRQIAERADFSYGISEFSTTDEHQHDVVTRADDAMYICKENKRAKNSG